MKKLLPKFVVLITIIFGLIFIYNTRNTKADFSNFDLKAADFCREHGYTYNQTDNTCAFPDGSKCSAVNFAAEICGGQYIKKFPCRKVGEAQTAAAYCCEGLTPLDQNKDARGNCISLDNVYPICSNCGNDICDPGEDYCNCRIDCKKSGDNKIIENTKGYILLQVQEKGEAWYVEPNLLKRYYMSNGDNAYGIMRTLGLGISNTNLAKIPAGILENASGTDSDSDGLDNKTEESLGTDPQNDDSDHDGYKDSAEVKSGYNPLGLGKMPTDKKLTNRLRGKIVLQVESRGEAWYIYPKDGKRYFLKDGDSAYQLMRRLGLGITNDNIFLVRKGLAYIPYHNKMKTSTIPDYYTITYPLGWTLDSRYPGPYIVLMNHDEKAKNYGDNVLPSITNKMIEMTINPIKLGGNELTDQTAIQDFERIKLCDKGTKEEITVDRFTFYICNQYDGINKAEIMGKLDENNYFLITSFYVDSTSDYRLGVIKDLVKTIRFLSF